MIEVLATGPQLSVQDLGRAGYTAWGIGQGGAADRDSLRLANRLVGNAHGAAGLEMLLAGATLRFDIESVIAVTGAACDFTLDGTPGECGRAFLVPAGTVVRFRAPRQRLRTYLAVRGGVATAPLLGSRSTDERSGLGGPLRGGDLLPIGADVTGPPLALVEPAASWPEGPVTLHAVVGPRDGFVTDESMRRLAHDVYTVDVASDRVGIRLAGPPLQRRAMEELLSEPTLRGAMEVPPDGLPIVFSADHPTTCGYPVVAVLESASADLLAQCRPGQAVRFSLTRLDTRIM
jgi:biotin-dependent carboxylase-like uncharacterized protein